MARMPHVYQAAPESAVAPTLANLALAIHGDPSYRRNALQDRQLLAGVVGAEDQVAFDREANPLRIDRLGYENEAIQAGTAHTRAQTETELALMDPRVRKAMAEGDASLAMAALRNAQRNTVNIQNEALGSLEENFAQFGDNLYQGEAPVESLPGLMANIVRSGNAGQAGNLSNVAAAYLGSESGARKGLLATGREPSLNFATRAEEADRIRALNQENALALAAGRASGSGRGAGPRPDPLTPGESETLRDLVYDALKGPDQSEFDISDEDFDQFNARVQQIYMNGRNSGLDPASAIAMARDEMLNIREGSSGFFGFGSRPDEITLNRPPMEGLPQAGDVEIDDATGERYLFRGGDPADPANYMRLDT